MLVEPGIADKIYVWTQSGSQRVYKLFFIISLVFLRVFHGDRGIGGLICQDYRAPHIRGISSPKFQSSANADFGFSAENKTGEGDDNQNSNCGYNNNLVFHL